MKCSAPNVVSVSKKGKVPIKGTGIAAITAKTSTDSVKITVKVRPKKPAVKSIKTPKGKKLMVVWAKDKMATGYQVQLSASKNFKKIPRARKHPSMPAHSKS
jgi:hypothetical protein